MKSLIRGVFAGWIAMILAACAPSPAGAPEAARGPVVFAAASLTDVLHEIGDLYAAAGHAAPRFNFAGSSTLARQIEQGGEADIFISADEDWMDYLAGQGLVDLSTRRTLVTNTLVLAAPARAPFQLEVGAGMDISGALGGGRLSLANPEAIPAGKYAREALEHLGVWASVEANIVRADNVRAALRYVETGDAAAGVVYGTDARASRGSVVVVGTFPEGSHTPITYPAAVLAGKSDGPGPAFLDFLTTPEAQRVFEAAGFGVAD